MIETADKQHEERYKNRWYGKYRAFVRDNNDPQRLGRVRMEIPAVLGTGRKNWSEWAYPCFPFGGNDGSGFFIVPDEGASVWAEFEGGHPQYPIWSGVWLAKSSPGEQPDESKRECSEATCLDCEDKLEHQNNAQDAREHQKYHQHPPYSCTRMKVLMKTETGHTIFCDDKDESECLKVIDRAGQGLHFESKVKRTVQAGNTLGRGMKEAELGDQLNVMSKVQGQRAKIEFTDLSRQFVRLEAWQDNEKIHIQSGDRSRARWQKILIDSTNSREKVHIWGLNGTQYLVIDSSAGKENITLIDKAGQVIRMDPVQGTIRAVDRAGSVVLMNGQAGNIVIQSAANVQINP